MRILKFLRNTYTGEEYLIEDDNQVLKRLKIVPKDIIGDYQNLVLYFKLFETFDEVIVPERYLFKDEVRIIFPYNREREIKLNEIDGIMRKYIAYKLLEFAKKVYDMSNLKLPVFSFDDILFTENFELKLLPPLWLNPKKPPKNGKNVFVAPEVLSQKVILEESTLYVIGKAIEFLNPPKSIRKISKNLLWEDPQKRRLLFNLPYSIGTFIKQNFVIPIIQRAEIDPVMKKIEDKTKKIIGIVGPQRIGKTTFLNNIQSILISEGKNVIRPLNGDDLILQLLRVSSGKVEKNLENILLNCTKRKICKIDTIASLLGEVIDSLSNVYIIVDDYHEKPEDFKALLLSLKSLRYSGRFLIIAASTEEFDEFDDKVTLSVFSKEDVKKLIERTFGKIEAVEPLVNFVFKLSDGYPGLVVEVLRTLIEKQVITRNLEKDCWKYDVDKLSEMDFNNISFILNDLDPETFKKISYLSFLGQKFTLKDIETLEKALNVKLSRVLNVARDMGIIYKEYNNYRFTLKQYWERFYYSFDEQKRKEIHLKIINAPSNKVYLDEVLLKNAWHYKMIGEYLKAFQLYIKVVKMGLEEYYSPSYLLKLITDAEQILPEGRFSYSLIRFKTEIYYRLRKKVDYEIPDLKLYEYWKAASKIIEMRNKEIVEFFEKDKRRLEGFGKLGTYRRKLLYYTALFNLGKIDKISVKELEEIYRSINSDSSFVNDVKIRSLLLISNIISTRDIKLALEYLNKAKDLAKNCKLYHLLPLIYNNIAVHIDNMKIASLYYDKSIEAAETAALPDLALLAKLNKINSLLYMGEIEEFFSQLNMIRKVLSLKDLKRELAYTYVLETFFHTYNRDFERGIVTINKAKDIEEALQIEKSYLRTLFLLYAFTGKIDKARALYRKNKEQHAFKVADFNLFADLVLADEKDFKEKWEKFRDSSTFLWREEAYALLGEKIVKVDPDGYFEHLKLLETDYATQNLRLSLALLYEGYAKYYKGINKLYRYQSYISKAYVLYNDIGFSNYADILKKSNEKFLRHYELISSYKEMISSNLISERVKVIINKSNFALKLLEELKAIEVVEDPMNIINYFAGKFYDMFPFKEVAIYIKDKRIEREFMVSNVEDDTLLDIQEDILRNEPLLIRISDKIDKFLEYYILLSNNSLYVDQEEMYRILDTLEVIEYAFVTVVKSVIARLRSVVDPLTKLYTRYYISEKLNEYFVRSKKFNMGLSVVMCDIDHFKKLNDKFGHLFGDKVLVKIAEVLKDNLRKNDIVGRYGGEEFIIVLSNTQSEVAVEISERLRKAIENINEFPVKVTLSFGIASMPELQVDSPEELIGLADDALYKAKELGRNRVVVFGKDI